jgi:HrpA-like RNA helicase
MEALPEFQLPEIKRTPLEELCLQVIMQLNGTEHKSSWSCYIGSILV